MKYTGLVYRALNPVYAKDPLSGQGAALFGGRFNPKGLGTLYTSLSPETAIRESNQVGTLQPTTLVAYRALIDRVFDTRDENLLNRYEMTQSKLSSPSWRDDMCSGKSAPTQNFAMRLIEVGYSALLVRSFARGATADDLNMVLWVNKTSAGVTLDVIDDEGRLE